MSSPKSSYFDMSHDVKMSFRMGALIPTCVMDVLPGDKIKIQVENLLRFAPLLSPLMHRVNVTTHYFFVPNRILWPGWEKWITGDEDAVPPFLDGRDVPVGSLGDYLGYPTGDTSADYTASAFPIAAYYKIIDEYYRDQNLVNEQFIELTAGLNAGYAAKLNAIPFKRAWMHDYFTSALPFAQKGDPVTLPLLNEDSVDVKLKDAWSTPGSFRDATAPHDRIASSDITTQAGGFTQAGSTPGAYDPEGTLEVDINEEATDINTLRRAFKLQEWLERNARGGTRYIENILAHFGVKSSDARLQRPEYMGGARQTMTISEVLSTAETVDSGDVTLNPVGQMAGHGISYGSGKTIKYRAEEHGWVIGIINVQPVSAYQQGLHRSFNRKDRFDYAWPTFANIGEQEVLNSEIYIDTDEVTRNQVFGYVPRYAEYKFMNSRVAGDFKDTLSHWHLGRIFSSLPTLNAQFVTCIPQTDRIFAVSDEDHIYANIYNKIGVVRKLPKYGVPTI